MKDSHIEMQLKFSLTRIASTCLHDAPSGPLKFVESITCGVLVMTNLLNTNHMPSEFMPIDEISYVYLKRQIL